MTAKTNIYEPFLLVSIMCIYEPYYHILEVSLQVFSKYAV